MSNDDDTLAARIRAALQVPIEGEDDCPVCLDVKRRAPTAYDQPAADETAA